jgi:hypothetical protein
MLKQLASRGERGEQLLNADETTFNPKGPVHRKADIGEARRLALSFARLEQAASDLDFVVDLPPQWVE